MRLLIISAQTATADQREGDIVGIFGDEHSFADYEAGLFDVVDGVTQAEYDAALARVPRYPLRWTGTAIEPNNPNG